MKLGEILVKQGCIDVYTLHDELIRQKQETLPSPLGKQLLQKKVINKDMLIHALAEQNSSPGIDILHADIQPAALSLLPVRQAYRYNVLPYRILKQHSGRTLLMATGEPNNLTAIQELSFITGYPVKPVYALKEDITAAITACYRKLDKLKNR